MKTNYKELSLHKDLYTFEAIGLTSYHYSQFETVHRN